MVAFVTISMTLSRNLQPHLVIFFRNSFRKYSKISTSVLICCSGWKICHYLGLTFRVPSSHISVCWLLVYDICMEVSYLREAYIFYYSFRFIDNSSSRKKKVMDKIFKKLNMSHSLQEEIKKRQLRLGKKKFTTKGNHEITNSWGTAIQHEGVFGFLILWSCSACF